MSIAARRVALIAAIALAGATAPSATPAHGASFTVSATHDAPDAAPGDGVCADSTGACTLRAAVEETNALPGADTISLSAGAYGLNQPGLTVTGGLVLTGSSAGNTVISPQNEDHLVRIMTLACDWPPADVEISNVTISGGSAYGGGGVENGCALTIRAVMMRDNGAQAGDGGAIRSPNVVQVHVIDSTFVGNFGQTGGAIYSNGTLLMENSTVSGNSIADYYGASVVVTGSARIVNSTITGNPRGIGGSSIELRNSIVAANTLSNCSVAASPGSIISLGHNLSSDDSCNFDAAGDLNNVDPQLTGLQNNGGPTFTHALYPGSPAIDAGDPNACPPADQRGIARPQGAACDIGAYEYVSPPPRPPTEPPTEAPLPADTATATATPGATLKPPSPSPSPSPTSAPSPSAAASLNRRVPTPAAAVLVDTPPVAEEDAGGGISTIAAGMAVAGMLGLLGSGAAGGVFWYRQRRRRIRPR